MSRHILFFPLLLLLVFLLNCGKDLPQLPGLELEIVKIELLDSLYLQAEIKFPSEEDKAAIDTRAIGFTLIHPNEEEEILEGNIDPINQDRFYVSKINLGLNDDFKVKAFVEVYDKFDKQFKKYFSETESFGTDGITITTKIVDITNGKVIVQTGVFGELVEEQVREVGIVSVTRIGASFAGNKDIDLNDKQVEQRKQPFQALYEDQIIVPLESANSYIFVRSYIIYRKDTVYGEMVSSQIGNFWEKIAGLSDAAGCRVGGIAFSIGQYGYVGLGVSNLVCDPTPSNLTNYRKDFWQYDSHKNEWKKMNPFPADFEPRFEATAFKIGDNGAERVFVGLGRQTTQYKDFWEYDFVNDDWIKRTDFPNTRRSVVSFVIDGKGYVGTGKMCDNTSLNIDPCSCGEHLCFTRDFYSFDPDGLDDEGLKNGKWTPIASLPETGIDGKPTSRLNAVGFAIGNKGYITTGLAQDSTGKQERYDGLVLRNPKTDLWEYDPSTDKWTQKADLPTRPREKAVGFSMGNYGYLATGGNQGFGIGINNLPTESDFWQYDPIANEWTELANIQDTRRWRGVSFVIENTAYIGMGIALKNLDITIDPNFYRYIPQE